MASSSSFPAYSPQEFAGGAPTYVGVGQSMQGYTAPSGGSMQGYTAEYEPLKSTMGVATFEKKYKGALDLMPTESNMKKKSRKVAGKILIEQTLPAAAAPAAPSHPWLRPSLVGKIPEIIPEIIMKAERFYKKLDSAKYPNTKEVDELWAHYEKEAKKLGLEITDFVEPSIDYMDYRNERNAR